MYVSICVHVCACVCTCQLSPRSMTHRQLPACTTTGQSMNRRHVSAIHTPRHGHPLSSFNDTRSQQHLCSRWSFRRDTCSLFGTNPFADSFQGVIHIAVGIVRNKPTVVIIENVIIPVQAWPFRSTAHSYQTLEIPLHL